MEQARTQLEGLSTARALPSEMTALNELLKAQAEIRRRQVQRQEANNRNGGGGSNRQGQDLSTLFDRELARQQTNYETPTTAETREQKPRSGDDALEKIRDLARRQDAINREQETLAKNREGLSTEELRRRLERLTREQSDLRQQAEDLSQQMQRSQQERGADRARQNARGGGSGQGSRSENERGPAGQALQQASEEMKNAASGLRRQDQGQAAASGQRALDRLRESEKSAGAAAQQNGRDGRGSAAALNDQRRRIGDLQLESRQLADAQRRLGREGRQPSSNDPDASRRRAGEQERLADRMQRLEDSVTQLADDRQRARGDGDRSQQSTALAEAARELAREKLAERMKSAAGAESSGRRSPGDPQEIARALDRLGDRLGAAAAGESPADRESSERMARARELREQLESVDRELSELQRNRAPQETPGRSGREQGPPMRPGGPGRPDGRAGSGPTPGRASGQANAASGAWQRARELVDQLRREEEIGNGAKDLEAFNPGLSAPGTEAFKQDFSKWERLKAQLSAALERVETDAAARLRARQADDRLNAGGSLAVPEQYRGMVGDYFRALAGPAPPRRPVRAK
jgi:hypothetical protein